MNLRTIYGDKVADDLLKRKLHYGEDGTFRFKFIHDGAARYCCVVGAANLIAARTYGHSIPEFVDTPASWKATTDAQYALDRQLTRDEERELAEAMDVWDTHERYDDELIPIIEEEWFAKEENEHES